MESKEELCNVTQRNSPDGHTLGLEVAPSLVHLLQPLAEERGVLLAVQPADQLLAGGVQAEEHVPVVLHLCLEVLARFRLENWFSLYEDRLSGAT